VVDDGAGVRRITAGEVEIQIDRFLGMEEIRPTHARRPDFEFDFGFLLFWFDDFRRVVEWATGFNGWQIDFFFFGFISSDLLLFWCIGFIFGNFLLFWRIGLMNFFPILGFCIFGLMGSNRVIG